MDRTIKALSLLLSYPTPELQEEIPEIASALNTDTRLSKSVRGELGRLTDALFGEDIYDLQERYVMLFDRSRTLSLNLFEHVHGESRERGSSMVSLLEMYRDGGVEPTTTELPDHLPVLLEFLALRPDSETRETLADAAHILAALNTRLVRRESPYSAVFAALLLLSGEKADSKAVAELLQRPEIDPNDLGALDEVWEESEVRFGPDRDAGCPPKQDVLVRMDKPVSNTSAHTTE